MSPPLQWPKPPLPPAPPGTSQGRPREWSPPPSTAPKPRPAPSYREPAERSVAADLLELHRDVAGLSTDLASARSELRDARFQIKWLRYALLITCAGIFTSSMIDLAFTLARVLR